jgi:apolipoprotein N-acyltransferase
LALLSLLSGVLLALCFPRFDLSGLAWLALVPLFLAVRMSRPRTALWCGYVAGLAFFWLHIGWLSIFGWYVGVAATLFEAVWLALFGALAAALVRRSPPWAIPAALAAAWTAVDWLRTLGPLGFSWGSLAISQHRVLPVLQIVDLAGPWGLTLLIALVNAALTEPLHARLRARVGDRVSAARRWGWPAVAGGMALLVALRGALVLAGAPPVPPATGVGRWAPAEEGEKGRRGEGESRPRPNTPLPGSPSPLLPFSPSSAGALRVAVVQGNMDQDVPWDSTYVQATMARYADLTHAAAAAGAEIIVWPETSLPGELRFSPDLLRQVTELAHATGAWLVVGSNDHDARDDRDLNQAFLVSPDREIVGAYAKVRLVPFGEFVPMRRLFPFLEQLHVRPFNLSPGAGFLTLKAGPHTLGALICFESAFPEVTRALVGSGEPFFLASLFPALAPRPGEGGAELLLELTNDTWFGRTPAAAQHAAVAALRAVETRRAFARAVTTGISQLIDPYGRIIGRVDLFQTGFIAATLPLSTARTPYVRWGDWAAYGAVLIVVGLLLRGRVGRTVRQEKHPEEPDHNGGTIR